MENYKVPINKLRKTCMQDELKFDNTSEIDVLEGIIGQERAVNAMEFGLRIRNKGYNIFMAGDNGTGKTSYAKSITQKVATNGKVPDDLCYVYNFKEPDRPSLIQLPPGLGEELVITMENFVDDIKNQIPKAFSGEEFENERSIIRERYQKNTNQLIQELDKLAKEKGFVIRQSSKGFVSVPLIDGTPVDKVDEELLTDEVTQAIQEKLPEMQKHLDEVMRKIRTLEKEATDELVSVEQRIALAVIQPEINLMKSKFKDHAKVLNYFNNVEKDVLENLKLFRDMEGERSSALLFPQVPMEDKLIRYKVNLFVNNINQKGAPVIFETNPNYYNLFGKIEGKAQLSGITTDFTMIKAGAVHKANGGYLVIHAKDLLKDPLAYDALKRTIQNEEAIIENIGEQFKIIPTATIKPEQIPIKIKVILIGSSYIQQLLYNYDEEFSKQFKIKAHFDNSMERNSENTLMYTQFISSVCKKEQLRHFKREAVAHIIEYSARLAGHQKKLSTRFNEIVEIIYEASAWAEFDDVPYTTADHVKKAINEKIHRANMLEAKIQENIIEGSLLIQTEGKVVGQINGLSVYSLGDYAFGKPSKITASSYLGKDGLINIEREAKLSGRIHDKGVLILTGYLGGKYAKERPLSLTASLCFEQSYGGVDGDSASCAELIAILSSITDIPIRQDIAITGSINQRGQVQPIGGANEKIEGFYRICKQRGLTGTQGVIIPKQNEVNLMLDDEIIEQCRQGKFNIYSITQIDEAIEILTGITASEFHKIVDKKLEKMATNIENFDK